MNRTCETPAERLCGCCDGVQAETPEPIFNRPGLSAIAYRVGTHNAFKASLLAGLTSSDRPALRALRTRDDSDFSIALLDAWATSLDILSFYQERIVNESYLRTAVDAASVMALAQLTGYRPSPGVAASAFLAFTLSDAPGAPDDALIPASTRVQSVPAPGQQPQVFETSSDFTARIERNAIPPQTTVLWSVSPGDTSMYFQGTANNISVGDMLLFISSRFVPSDPYNSGGWDYRFVTSVKIDFTAKKTWVTWDLGISAHGQVDTGAGKPVWFTAGERDVTIYIFRKKAALYGVQAPDPRTLGVSSNGLSNVPGWPGGTSAATTDWNFIYQSGSLQISLDASYPGVVVSPSGPQQWVVFDIDPLFPPYLISAVADFGPLYYTLPSKTTQLTLTDEPLKSNSGDLWLTTDEFLSALVEFTRSTSAYVQSEPLTPADPPLLGWDYDGKFQRQAGLLKPVEGSHLATVTAEQISAGQVVAISGKRLRLQVSAAIAPLDAEAGFVPDGKTEGVKLSDGQVFIVDAFPPIPAPSGSDLLWSVLTTDGVAGTLQINSANVVLVSADKDDIVVGESALVSDVTVAGPVLTFKFTQALARIYDRATVTVNANVVAATNGETMHEILGSGDATNSSLEFTLKQSPLTYVSSSIGLGASSTLQVWVNNLRWHEVDNFLQAGAADRVFTTQIDSKAKVTVEFGDGRQGERTPTGQMNIRAVYRKGIGAAGNVAAGQLSQALDRPQGLKGVINPDPASGGADPDGADAARASAPLHVLTLDRVVSLEDYQNYALAFAGIAKALATWTWVGRARSVFLTVAGANGLVFRQDDETIINLIKALHSSGNRYVPLQVASYRPVFFEVGANVRIDTDNYDPTLVMAQVWQSLSNQFNFAQRQSGQGVAQSEVIAAIQQIPGVVAVQLTALQRQGRSPALEPLLRASSPVAGQEGTPQGAEMLLLDPASQGNLEVWS